MAQMSARLFQSSSSTSAGASTQRPSAVVTPVSGVIRLKRRRACLYWAGSIGRLAVAPFCHAGMECLALCFLSLLQHPSQSAASVGLTGLPSHPIDSSHVAVGPAGV